MKRKMALLLAIILTVSVPEQAVYASTFESENVSVESSTESVDSTEEIDETQEVNEEVETTESEENVVGTEELLETTESTEAVDEYSEEYQEELKNILMDGVESLPDDPEYIKIYEQRLEEYNNPSLLSFAYDGYTHDDRFKNTTIRKGIDVSYYQQNIDWNRVKNSGEAEFAFVRVGYRGAGEGQLQADVDAGKNLSGAAAAGLRVGAYMFSQAITVQEAEEEARFALSQISGYSITMPIVIDYEYYRKASGRLYNAHLSKEQATDIVNAFCAVIKNAGYTPMVYANKSMLKNNLNAENIPYKIWLAHYVNQSTDYQGAYEFWQYRSNGTVPGISGKVDCDFWYDDGSSDGLRPIEDGEYVIESAANTGLALSVQNSSKDNSANIQLGNDGQTFKVTYLGNGKYTLMSAGSGKYVDIYNRGTANGTNILQFEGNGQANQQWMLQDAGNGYYYIKSANCDKYMDIYNGEAKNGANVQLWELNRQDNQKFRFRKADSNSGKQFIQDGTYQIESAVGSGYVLDVTGASKDNGANIELWKGDQTFTVKYLGNGIYSFIADCSGKYIDVCNGGTSNGTNILQFEGNGQTNQQWILKDAGNGYYYIQSANCDKYMDVDHGRAENGANVDLWEFNGQNNQKFCFRKMNDTPNQPSTPSNPSTPSQPSNQVIKDGEYQIESALKSGMFLDVNGASAGDGANIQLWGGNQTFKIKYLGNDRYSIMATCSGKYVDAANGGTTNGTNVLQFGWNGGNNQQWIFRDAGNGYYYIKSANCEEYLDVDHGRAENGSNIGLWEFNGQNNQKFRLNAVGDNSSTPTTGTIADGNYKIESALKSGAVLDVNGAVRDYGANIQLWGGDQTFKVTSLGNGIYSLMANCSGLYMDAENGGSTNGTNVLQYGWNGGDNQKWYIQDAGDGYYYIVSVKSGLRVDVDHGSTDNGTNVLLWSANSGNNQKFKFVRN